MGHRSPLCAPLLLVPCVCIAIFSNAGAESSPDKRWEVDSENRTHFWCPDQCTCSYSAKIVDCSGRGLTYVPRLAASTTRVYLYDNAIGSLDRSQFHHLHHLTYLILANNAVSSIEADTFKGLHSLKYLIMDRNLITELPSGVFKDLPHLETVSLAHNKLKSLSGDIFTNNYRLSLINLQGNQLESVDDRVFSHLLELHTLDLQRNGCSGSFLRSLRACRNLTILRLNDNKITNLPPDGLQLPSLQLLYLSNNLIKELPPHLFNQTHNIIKLDLKHNAISTLPQELFTHTPALKGIFLQTNNISHLEGGVFRNLQRLEGIFLSQNGLEVIPPHFFHNLTALYTLHLEGNQLATLGDRSFSLLSALETLYLQNNHIIHISDGAFVELPKLKYLALYGNGLPVESIGHGVLNSIKSLIKIQLDVFPCSCNLSYLASWSKRHGVRGLYCTSPLTGKTVSLTHALEECHVDSNSEEKRQFESKHFNSTVGTLSEPEQVSMADVLNNTTYKLKEKIEELQLRIARLEVAVEESCEHWVCLYNGLRLEAGDTWRENNNTCYCSHAGRVECYS